ncbi:hypothetical protein QAD02_004450 [Eretmocerus hayati]|uniref:Uncharacterized protein n=1 Tax=Eretmocerus hayati TaxID=131215 RepID=A0ACC2NQV6_9HYME|nr:hypothetical protein QAD02_004450 [Eretmocerus hayati]
MYSLKTRKVEGGELEWCLQTSLSALIGLVKYSSMFKAYSNPSNIGSLLKDDSIIFSGTFLLKLFIVITTKYATTDLYDPHEEADVHSRWNPGENTRIPGSMEPLMSCITLAFVAITACNPNMKMILTHTNRYIVYALTPIKKGEPLSTCLECIYLRIPKHKRQAAHQGMFKQPCDCRACVENWSDILDNDAIFENILKDKIHIAEKMVEEKEWIEAESDARGHRLNWPDPKLISRSKKFVIEAWKHFSMPSPITVEAIRLMIALLSYQHSPRVQDFEREIFCKM